MMKRILLPTDYSENADRAVQYALRVFGKEIYEEEVEFVLLHVQPPVDATVAVSPYVAMSPEILREADLQSMEGLHKEAAKYEQLFPDQFISEVLVKGSYVHAINHVARDEHIDLIVMGARGKRFLERMLMGTTSMGVAENAPCPVIVVPGRYEEEVSMDRIILAGDFTHGIGKDEFAAVAEMVNQYHAELLVVHAIEPDELPAVDRNDLREEMKKVLPNIDFQEVILEEGNLLHLLEETVQGFDADMLVYLPEDKGFFESLLSGDATKQLLMHLDIPVMILHSRQEEASGETAWIDKERWQRQLDDLAVQMDLGKREMQDEWKEAQVNTKKRVKQLRTRLDELEDNAGENWAHFRAEMKTAWKHVRAAFKSGVKDEQTS